MRHSSMYTVWLTRLSGAGKSTLVIALAVHFKVKGAATFDGATVTCSSIFVLA